MKYRVIIANEVLEAVGEHLQAMAALQGSWSGAERWWRKARTAVESLTTLPHRFPLAPENDQRDYTIRMVIVEERLFLYTVVESDRAVRIIGFRHGRQQPQLQDLPGVI